MDLTFKDLLTFTAALTGAVVGTPFIEWVKDRISTRRLAAMDRRKTIESLRFILANLEVFVSHLTFPFQHSYSKDELLIHTAALRAFDFGNVEPQISTVISIGAKHVETSGVSQALAEKLLGIVLLSKVLQESLKDKADEKQGILPRFVKEDFVSLKLFIRDSYASKIGINPYSVIADFDVLKADLSDLERRRRESMETIEQAQQTVVKIVESWPQESSEPSPKQQPAPPNPDRGK